MREGITVVGLGPAGLDRLRPADLAVLEDERAEIIVRTAEHPAASELAARRAITACDDLYRQGREFDDVYDAIATRVLDAAHSGPVVFAVPGSPLVGERTVLLIVARAAAAQIRCEVRPGESFIDLACAAVGIDPISDGLQVLDARSLPDPLPLHLPTLIAQIDTQLVAGDVALSLGRTLPDDYQITIIDRIGDTDGSIRVLPLSALAKASVGPRTSLFVPAAAVGILGLVATNRILRLECPWDAEQTHHTLVSHLIEETYETVDAIAKLPAAAPGGETDFGAYAELEEELGDLLIQVVFHSTMAQEAGAFDLDEVAEGIRRKIVSRHPHVFGDVVVADAGEVVGNWEEIKSVEKRRDSLMDDIPSVLPGTARADKIQSRVAAVGFDWPEAAPVFAKVEEELAELREVAGDRDAATGELGDLLFSVVNLARHLDVDPDIALARANDKFTDRFRVVEQLAKDRGLILRELSLDELDGLWEEAKGVASRKSQVASPEP
ncbi:MAG: nucleoside triphosphate pyrophosphohydrolase [Acidimicrobiia bacterium]|nr:MAG: nucleoside triphosphate pyrophosphohydrolase [Acidimicrobiia bacterium]